MPKAGMKMGEEHRRKISEALRGRVHTAEHRATASRVRIGRAVKLYKYGVTDEEYRSKIEGGFLWCCHSKHFYHKSKAGTVRQCCAECQTEWSRKHRLRITYGLTQKQYEDKLTSQGGGCAICGSDKRSKGKSNMMIDHNHTTGAVRGILCHSCNAAVERLETIPNWDKLAVAYLARFALC